MEQRAIVTGANGHLGNNLVRLLRKHNVPVTALFRDTKHIELFKTLGCDTAITNLLDKASLVEAFTGAKTIYHTGAVFKHWAKNPEQEIYDANITSTRNVMEAARAANVERIIYISSLAALDRTNTPITEQGWNPDRSNTYFRSKTDSEKLAWELADKLNLDMISILPSAMINGQFSRLTPTLSVFPAILNNELRIDPGFYLNFVDVKEVAQACIDATIKGRPGERYLIANQVCTGVGEMVNIANTLFPELKLSTPKRPPKALLYMAASIMELLGKLAEKEPLMQRNFLEAFTVREICDISKARRELDFNPTPPEKIIGSTFQAVRKFCN